MDRIIVSPSELALDTDLLKCNRNVMVSIGKLSSAILGTSTVINDLACTPTGPASLNVTVGAGEIYQLLNIDSTPYGTLPADTTHQILKQGIRLDSSNFSCPAPSTSGFSINYLIQVSLTEADVDGTSRAFFNSDDPNGIPPVFLTTNETRQDLCNVQVKAGTAATTGSQVTPSPDAGFVGAWVITVANGQTAITAANISKYVSAPFIVNRLTDRGLDIPNIIIGGDFSANPWQRGTSFSPVANAQFTADRMCMFSSTPNTYAVTRDGTSFPTAAQAGVLTTASLKVTVLNTVSTLDPAASFSLRYPVEGYNFLPIAQKEFTISFWVKSSLTGVYSVNFENAGPDRSYVAEYTIDNANTWEFKKVTVPPSPADGTWVYNNTGIGLSISFSFAAGSGYVAPSINTWLTGQYHISGNQVNFLSGLNTLNFALIQLEPGNHATPFKSRSVGEELALCQRYYEKTYNLDVAPGAISEFGALEAQIASGTARVHGLNMQFKAAKRSSPTVNFYSPLTGAAGHLYNLQSGVDVAVSSIVYTGISSGGVPELAAAGSDADSYFAQIVAESEL